MRRSIVLAAIVVVSIAVTGCGASSPASPELTATPTASVSPSVAESPTPGATAEPVSDDGTPATDSVPASLWDAITPGWVLTVTTMGEVGSAPTRQVVELVSPEGARYHVLDLDPAHSVALLAWSAGESRAVVSVGTGSVNVGARSYGGDTPTDWLDLTSGDLTPVDLGGAPGGPSADVNVVSLADGMRVWDYFAYDHSEAWIRIDGRFDAQRLDGYWGAWAVSPDGLRFSVQNADESGGASLVDARTGLVTSFVHASGPTECGVFVWTGADTFIEGCGPEQSTDYFTVDLRAGTRVPIPNPDGMYPLLGAKCMTSDGQPWGSWIASWGDWYEPYFPKIAGGSGTPRQVTLADDAGTPYAGGWVLGCAADAVIVDAEYQVSMDEPSAGDLIAYAPSTGFVVRLAHFAAGDETSGYIVQTYSVVVAR